MRQKFTFKYEGQLVAEDCKLQFKYDMDEEVSLVQIHSMCKRFAQAMGFAEASVDKVFGEDHWEGEFLN